MKKIILTLSLIFTISAANAKVDPNYGNVIRKQLTNFCWQMMNEDGPVAKVDEAKKFCKNVANCVVDNTPNDFFLHNSEFIQNSYLRCMGEEAQKLN